MLTRHIHPEFDHGDTVPTERRQNFLRVGQELGNSGHGAAVRTGSSRKRNFVDARMDEMPDFLAPVDQELYAYAPAANEFLTQEIGMRQPLLDVLSVSVLTVNHFSGHGLQLAVNGNLAAHWFDDNRVSLWKIGRSFARDQDGLRGTHSQFSRQLEGPQFVERRVQRLVV